MSPPPAQLRRGAKKAYKLTKRTYKLTKETYYLTKETRKLTKETHYLKTSRAQTRRGAEWRPPTSVLRASVFVLLYKYQ